MKLDGEEQILIVEDDGNDACFITRALEDAGIKQPPQVVENGRKAIEYLQGTGRFADRKRFPYPQFILTDLKMPVASGFDLLQWLKGQPELRVIPTVVFSSSSDPEDVKRAHCLRASAYISKPADPLELKRVIHDLLRFWANCERPQPAMPPSCDTLATKQY